MAKRDITNFVHLKKIREENVEMRKTDQSLKLKHNSTSESVMKEIENNRLIEKETGIYLHILWIILLTLYVRS